MEPTPYSGSARRVVLKFPVTWAGEEIRELNVKRPTAAQLWNLKVSKDQALEFGQVLSIAAKCCGLPDDAIRLLDIEDAIELSSIMGEHLGSGRPTGT